EKLSNLWQQSSRKGRSRHSASRRRERQLRLEPLEDRVAPATLTVTTLSDAASHTGVSLRDAITSAHSGDTIQFQPGLTGAIDLSTAEGGQGKLTLSKNLTITGLGATITVEGGASSDTNGAHPNNSQVFAVSSGATVS